MAQEFASATLLLIRHGQARDGSASLGRTTPLSDLGRKQAVAIARALSDDRTDAVYTSPLPRAIETAAPLCTRLNLAPILEPRLTEFEMGTLAIEAIQARPDLAIWRPDDRAVDGESLSAFSARVADLCRELTERHVGERIAVIAHAGTIDAALRWSLGLTPASPWQHEFDLANGSITEIEFWPRGRVSGGAPRYSLIRRVGDVLHLGGLNSDL